MIRSVDLSESALKIVPATPVGQQHGLGALSIALIASESVWRSLYLENGVWHLKFTTVAKST